MTSDDMLSYLASQPKRKRPHELKSDVKMLWVWQTLRNNKEFYDDVILRHGLEKLDLPRLNPWDVNQEHAISNAWGHCMQHFVEEYFKENEVKVII